jgi:transcription elongation factor Elf1
MSELKKTHSDKVECPHCGHMHDDWEDLYDMLNSGDAESFECGECEKEFEVLAYTSYSFTSRPIPCTTKGIEHSYLEWKGPVLSRFDNKYFVHRECSICGQFDSYNFTTINEALEFLKQDTKGV